MAQTLHIIPSAGRHDHDVSVHCICQPQRVPGKDVYVHQITDIDLERLDDADGGLTRRRPTDQTLVHTTIA